MVRRFTLIQGGLSEPALPDPNPEALARAPLEVDLRTPAGVDADAAAAWRALMTRTGIDDPFQDPDYLLTAAQHQGAGQRLAFALVWSRLEARPALLQGVLPLAFSRPILARERAQLWQPPGLSGVPTVERARADAVVEAVRERLRGLDRPAQLVMPATPRDEAASMQASLRLVARGRRSIPSSSLLGVRPDGYRAADVEHVRDPAGVRDAVESFLALDARTARRPIIADPADAAMVRVVSRLFARRRQIGVELTRRGGTVVAGTLHLGAGPGAVPWRRAAG